MPSLMYTKPKKMLSTRIPADMFDSLVDYAKSKETTLVDVVTKLLDEAMRARGIDVAAKPTILG